jgi:hypothetical protein
MLERECVVAGQMGRVLAAYLVEYLPFETEAAAMIHSVRLVLQPGLIDDAARRSLWARGKSKSALHIGFMMTTPDHLPEPAAPRADLAQYRPALESLAASGNACAAKLLQVLDSPGQAFLQVADKALRRPSNQDAAVCLLNAIGAWFRSCQLDAVPQDMEAIIKTAHATWTAAAAGNSEHADLNALAAAVPSLANEVQALLVLSQVDENLLTPIFSRTTAIGTVMSKKMEPVVTPILQQFAALRGVAG